MDRNTNINCLSRLFDTFEQTSDQAATIRLRQAMYVHGIVEAVLSERVDLLPEACKATI